MSRQGRGNWKFASQTRSVHASDLEEGVYLEIIELFDPVPPVGRPCGGACGNRDGLRSGHRLDDACH